MVMAVGGSTNAVLHLLAIAKAAGVPLALDDFQKASDRVPLLADLKPSGKYVQEDLHSVGGTPALMKYLLERGFLHGDCMTVTGKTLAENLAGPAAAQRGQQIIQPIENPVLAARPHPDPSGATSPRTGAVAKITGKEGERFAGAAKVYDSEEAMLAGLEQGEIVKGTVVVIRYEGPKGGPGMPEMLTPTSAIMGAGLGQDVAMLTDGRFSGGSHGFIIGHITPEAQEGGPIALVRDGDRITIDATACALNVELSDAELAAPEARGARRTRRSTAASSEVRTAGPLSVRGLCHRLTSPGAKRTRSMGYAIRRPNVARASGFRRKGDHTMALRLGDEAPDFSADTTEGHLNFREWKGNGWAGSSLTRATLRRCARRSSARWPSSSRSSTSGT